MLLIFEKSKLDIVVEFFDGFVDIFFELIEFRIYGLKEMSVLVFRLLEHFNLLTQFCVRFFSALNLLQQ